MPSNPPRLRIPSRPYISTCPEETPAVSSTWGTEDDIFGLMIDNAIDNATAAGAATETTTTPTPATTTTTTGAATVSTIPIFTTPLYSGQTVSHRETADESASPTGSPGPHSRSDSEEPPSTSGVTTVVDDDTTSLPTSPHNKPTDGMEGVGDVIGGGNATNNADAVGADHTMREADTTSSSSHRHSGSAYDMSVSGVSSAPDNDKIEEDGTTSASIKSDDLVQCDAYSPSMGYEWSNVRVIPTSSSSYLRPGSKFHGMQQSERQVYDVQVEIKYVDFRESFLCGYLKIQGLTEDNPTLTTYFEGEIIGNKYGFVTKHESWGANEKIDYNHWAKFSAFKQYSKQMRKQQQQLLLSQQQHASITSLSDIPSTTITSADQTTTTTATARTAAASRSNSSGIPTTVVGQNAPAIAPSSSSSSSSPTTASAPLGSNYVSNFTQRENIFMRWKEHFLVPDHRVTTITGASFEGFYYICFNQKEGSVSGIYFHSKSEKFQQLELKHVEDRGCFSAVEFR